MSEIGHRTVEHRIPKRGRAQVRGRGLDYVPRSSLYEVDAEGLGQCPPDLIEIGFGTGESVFAIALEQPERRILAVDIYERGAARLLQRLGEQGLSNVKVSTQDARIVLDLLAPASVDEVRAFFPDPWPKRKHRDRRLIDTGFLDRLTTVLRPGGIFWLATDAPDYAAQVRELAADVPALVEVSDAGLVRPPTKYSRRALELGHICLDVLWRRSP